MILARRSGITVEIDSFGIVGGYRRTHLALKSALNLQTTEKPTYNIEKLRYACTIAHKRALKTLNWTIKDLHSDSRCFGDTMILFSGDFRQILLIISRSTVANEVNACAKPWNLWRLNGLISFLPNFCNFVSTKDDLNSERQTNYKDHN